MRVLVVDVDDTSASILVRLLGRQSIHVVLCASRVDVGNVLSLADVVLLDLGVSDADCIAMCRAIRAVSAVPVIIITEHACSVQRIQALYAGADDYLIKPYDADELVARIRIAHRQGLRNHRLKAIICHGDVMIDLVRQTVRVAGQQIALPRKEFQILALIASANGAVCMRDRLVNEVWGDPWPGAQATLSVHLNALRARLGRPGLIETVRGLGYRLAATQAQAHLRGSPAANPWG